MNTSPLDEFENKRHWYRSPWVTAIIVVPFYVLLILAMMAWDKASRLSIILLIVASLWVAVGVAIVYEAEK